MRHLKTVESQGVEPGIIHRSVRLVPILSELFEDLVGVVLVLFEVVGDPKDLSQSQVVLDFLDEPFGEADGPVIIFLPQEDVCDTDCGVGVGRIESQ